MRSILQTGPAPESRNWIFPVLVGGGIMLALICVLYFVRSSPRPTTAPDAYAASLAISDIKMSTANNFAGTTVTYIDGTITNSGGKTVTAATVEATFRDSIKQVAQRDVLPLHVLKASNLYDDIVDLNQTPLAPGQAKPFRLTFDHISAEWAQTYPEIRVMAVTAK